MKSILISIQPYWVFLIIAKIMGWNVDKQKNIEVRKNYPKDQNWNKGAKIYCSKDKKSFSRIPKEYQPFMEKFLGKVIGEFVCNAIISHCEMANADIAEYQVCIKREHLLQYANGKELYGWHISDLVIYDKPRELREFWQCGGIFNAERDNIDDIKIIGNNAYKPITRPPQSWCYVEEVHNG